MFNTPGIISGSVKRKSLAPLESSKVNRTRPKGNMLILSAVNLQLLPYSLKNTPVLYFYLLHFSTGLPPLQLENDQRIHLFRYRTKAPAA